MTLLLASTLAGHVEESLASWVQESCEATTVEVVYSGLAVQVPADAMLIWDGQPCHQTPSVRMTVVEDGVAENRYTIRPRLAITVSVPVARTALRSGQLVEVEEGEVSLFDVRGKPIEGEGALIARRTIEAGEPITTANARIRPDGRKGEAVTLFVQFEGLLVEAPGTLQSDATYGESVRVVNEATRTVVTGVLVEPGRVQIQ